MTKNFSKRMLVAVTGLIVLLSACKKDKADDNPAPAPAKKLVRVEENANSYLNFEYNSDGTLKKVVVALDEEDGPSVKVLTLAYGENKKISRIDTEEGFHINYRYEDGNLMSTEVKDAQNQTISASAFAYENGRLVNFGEFYPFPAEDGSDIITHKRVREMKYTYHADGNIRTVTTSLLNPLTDQLEKAGSRVYDSYDGKKNPIASQKEFSLGFFQEFSSANIINEKVFDGDGAMEETIERTYTYDANGFPLTSVEKTTPAGQPAQTKNFKFIYN